MHRLLRQVCKSIVGTAAIASVLVGASTAADAATKPFAPPSQNGGGQGIVGGHFATGSKPWIAALHYNGGFTCTATHIAPQWVLTAAHCVSQNSGYSVRIGSLQRSSGGTVISVAQVYRHPNYAWPAHDIALLRLSQSKANTFIPLATQSDVSQGQAARVYGWGSEHADWSGPLPENLKYADGTISDADCVDTTTPLLCTQTDGSIAGGDSGGPVFISGPSGWRLGGDCAVGHKPAGSGWAAYTSVARHRSWISSIAGV